MALGKAEIHAGARSNVQLVWRDVIAHLVAAVLGKPQYFRQRIPVKSNSVADAARKDLEGAAVRFHPGYGGIRIRRFAHITRRADIGIQHAVRTKCQKLPAVMLVRRETRVNQLRPGRILQLRFNIIVTPDPVDLGYI